MNSSAPSELRSADRAAITLRVDYKRLNTFFSDYTKNISKGGTFIRTPKPLPVGTQFLFVLALPEQYGELELLGEVVWNVHHGESSGDLEEAAAKGSDESEGMGIRFIFRSADERNGVEEFVENLMREALGEHLSSRLLRPAKKDG